MAVYTTIDDPSAYFQVATYTGNATNRTITNDGNSDLQPDLIWFFNRASAGFDHYIYDSTRGVGKNIFPNADNAEGVDVAQILAFNSDGFNLKNSGATNGNGNAIVAWQWNANDGTTSANSDGNGNDVTIQVNSTSGMSIMKWTGTGNNTATVGHGLGVKPHLIINKALEASQNWSIAFPYVETAKLMAFNSNSAFFSASGMSSYNASTFVDGSGGSSEDYIAYCFKNIQGYSKIGTYTGNGNAVGTFVHTGFKPAFLITKNTQNSANWSIFDNERSVNRNQIDERAWLPGQTEQTSYPVDFLSNGFKLRANDEVNNSGQKFAYICFAQEPFVTSTGIPATAE